jgi:DNA invertase Pin-like site-specific DNA recombinase
MVPQQCAVVQVWTCGHVALCTAPLVVMLWAQRRLPSRVGEQFITYVRVSTRKQGRSGLGLEAQQRDLSLYLDQVGDAEVIAAFQEVESGKEDINRPELQKALELARKTGAVLLVSKLCRLSRDAAFVLTLMKDKKASFRVASMPHADNFQLGIWAVLNQQEREMISARTKAALASAVARGVKLGGLRRRTEACNQARRLEAMRRAQSLRMVLSLREAGLSFGKIAASLNDAGVPTGSGQGKWHSSAVLRVWQRLNDQEGSAAVSRLAA